MIGTLDHPTAKIRMHVDSRTEATKRIKACAKERETVEFIEALAPGSVFYDIGSNTGAYSFVASHHGLQVVAFEPAAPNYAQLVRNMALNPGLEVLALPYLLTSKTGQVGFSYASLEAGAALHAVGYRTDLFVQNQIGWALDDLLRLDVLPAPGYIKLDVDGHELDVLKGAQNTLKGVESLLVEVDNACADSRYIGSVLGAWGFSARSIHPHGSSSVSNVIYEKR